jgi:signal transduction histidine kinase/CheY-like chemotaxis protein
MKQQRAFKKIDRKIYVVFFIVIAIAITNAVISTYTISNSHQITTELVNNTNPSVEAIARFNLLVTRSRMLITNWVYLPNGQSDKDSLRVLNYKTYPELKGRLTGLMKHWDDKGDIRKMNNLFAAYDELISKQSEITRQLVIFDDYNDAEKKFAAEEILETEIIPRSEYLTSELRSLLTQQTEVATREQDRMLYSFNTLMVLVLGIALLIICTILFAAVIISRSIIVPIMQVRSVIMQMGRGELPDLRMKIPKNAVGEMMQALRFMIDGFRQTSQFVEEIGKGNFDHPYKPLSANDVQGHALLRMRNQLKEAYETETKRTWVSEGLAEINEIMRLHSDDFNILLDRIIETIVHRTGAHQSAIFLLHNEDLNDLHIQLGSYYALNNRILNSKRYELREGLIGQAIASNKSIILDGVSDPFFTIDTGLGESHSCSIMIIPLSTSGKVVGAIQVAALNTFSAEKRELLQKMAEPIAASLFSVRANLITSQLLEESRKQAEELAFQEQELRKINNELTKQSQLLQESEEELKSQQEELKQVNSELEEKARLLEEKNMTIEDARQSLAFKAEQLEQSNRYKSAFLANMSHELRTPLNSILILARLLAENKNNRLDEKQTEHARVIHKSGSDLLNLINDILDLSKIEAGKVELQYERLEMRQMAEDMSLLFRELANEKQTGFEVELGSESIILDCDKMRLEQVVKNLLSNAFKFTPANGKVELKIEYAAQDRIYQEKELLKADRVVCISVKDTGVGIPEEKQKLVFEAFQQADGSTSRKFGGTGLGLAISRELVNMMGGEISLESREGKGSTFTIHLPQTRAGHFADINQDKINTITKTNHPQTDLYTYDEIKDDRNQLTDSDIRILIIEDDYVFARMLMNTCNRFGFKAITALQGEQGLAYTRKYRPHAIILDMRLPVMDGWMVLRNLKEDPALNQIPVHIISAVDKKELAIEMGASSYLSKPAGKKEMDELFNLINDQLKKKNLLYLGKRSEEVQEVVKRLKDHENRVHVTNALSIEECESLAAQMKFDGFIIDPTTTDSDIAEKAEHIIPLNNTPRIIAGESLQTIEAEVLNIISHPDHTIYQQSATDKATKSVGERMEKVLINKTVLVADDDMRNIYSMTHILEEEGIKVICAYDGKEALQRLKENPDISLVLMDVMMPEMNGLEATATIRNNDQWKNLPVIAVTAKAMPGDREICMKSGASDYLTKPIRSDQLMSMLKVWLYK